MQLQKKSEINLSEADCTNNAKQILILKTAQIKSY